MKYMPSGRCAGADRFLTWHQHNTGPTKLGRKVGERVQEKDILDPDQTNSQYCQR